MESSRFTTTLAIASAMTLMQNACRPQEDRRMGYDMQDVTRRDVPEADEVPDTLRDPWLHDDWYGASTEPAPDTLPSGTEPDPYATDVVMFAGCEHEPETIAVAARHRREATCEHLVPVAAYDDGDGNFDEVATPFVMASTRPFTVDLAFPLGPNDNYAIPLGLVDIFDGDAATEPTATVIACAVNDCPSDVVPTDCPLMVCTTVTVASVANMEGTWTVSDLFSGEWLDVHPLQDGRSFEGDHGLRRGLVQGLDLTFDIGDYRYVGSFAGDRDHASGEVVELMGHSVIGTWSAERTAP